MVLICVTAFKDHHKIQYRCENREYVVEKQPYPNVLVYVVHLRDGEGHSQTPHRNYLLPINSNVGQDEKNVPMAGDENTNPSTPAPPVDSEPADAGPSRLVMSSTAGNTPQDILDQPAPHRHGTQKAQNQLPWSYWNFGLLADNSPSGIRDPLVGLCICLHVISHLCTVFWESTV